MTPEQIIRACFAEGATVHLNERGEPRLSAKVSDGLMEELKANREAIRRHLDWHMLVELDGIIVHAGYVDELEAIGEMERR